MDTAGSSPVARFVFGAKSLTAGFALLRQAGVAWLAWTAAILHVVLVTGGVVLLAGGFADAVAPYLPAGDVAWLGALLRGLATLFGALMGALCGFGVATVLCDPLYDLLSERVEAQLLGRVDNAPFSLRQALVSMWRELWATLLRGTIYLAVALPLWLLGLTGVGSIIALPLSLAWTWLFVALEGVSRSQARHAVAGASRLFGLSRQPAVYLGFGAASWLLLWVPLSMPVVIAAGTRLFLLLAANDQIPSQLSDSDKAALRVRQG